MKKIMHLVQYKNHFGDWVADGDTLDDSETESMKRFIKHRQWTVKEFDEAKKAYRVRFKEVA